MLNPDRALPPAMSEDAIREALAAHEFAAAKKLARESVAGAEAPVPTELSAPVAIHEDGCDCGPCEDSRRISIGLLPKDEERYPEFLPRPKRFFEGTMTTPMAEQRRISSALYLGKKP